MPSIRIGLATCAFGLPSWMVSSTSGCQYRRSSWYLVYLSITQIVLYTSGPAKGSHSKILSRAGHQRLISAEDTIKIRARLDSPY